MKTDTDNLNYLGESLKKDAFLIKGIKAVRLLQHTLYYHFRKKVGSYPPPDTASGIRFIAFFDRDRRIHVPEKSDRDLFAGHNLYQTGQIEEIERDLISVVSHNGKLLLKKGFRGIMRYARFYNEIICLHRLQTIDEVPRVVFVDYDKCEIFMEFIDGVTLSWKRAASAHDLEEERYKQLTNRLEITLDKIHQQGILLYDLKGSNILKKGPDLYFIDFGDSVYHGKKVSSTGLMDRYRKREKEKLQREIEKLKNHVVLLQDRID